MINWLACKISLWLEKIGAISHDEEALYRYAAFNVLYAAFPILIMLMIGIILHVIYGTIFFIITFVFLRKYTGGFHFHSLKLCICCSILIEFIFIYIASIEGAGSILIPLMTLLSFSLIRFSPISSDNRPLSVEDISLCKRRVKVILVFFQSICYILYMTKAEVLAAYPASAIIMVAVFQYPVIIRKMWRSKP